MAAEVNSDAGCKEQVRRCSGYLGVELQDFIIRQQLEAGQCGTNGSIIFLIASDSRGFVFYTTSSESLQIEI